MIFEILLLQVLSSLNCVKLKRAFLLRKKLCFVDKARAGDAIKQEGREPARWGLTKFRIKNFTSIFPRKLIPNIYEGGCPRRLICAWQVRLVPVRLSAFCRVCIGCVAGKILYCFPDLPDSSNCVLILEKIATMVHSQKNAISDGKRRGSQ